MASVIEKKAKTKAIDLDNATGNMWQLLGIEESLCQKGGKFIPISESGMPAAIALNPVKNGWFQTKMTVAGLECSISSKVQMHTAQIDPSNPAGGMGFYMKASAAPGQTKNEAGEWVNDPSKPLRVTIWL